MDWTPVREAVAKHGMRNSNCMAIAPTATISNIAGCYPSIEPMYTAVYVKSNMSGEFTVVNRYLVEDLKKMGLWNKRMLEEIKMQRRQHPEDQRDPDKDKGEVQERLRDRARSG